MISFKGVQTETRDGNTVYYYRTRKGRRIRLPDDKSSENFAAAVRLAATIGEGVKRTKRPSGAELRRHSIGLALQEAVRTAKIRARKRRVPFDIDLEWAISQAELQELKCCLTSIPFYSESAALSYRNPFAPSLDRIDAKGGYTRDNVRIVVFAINVMMMDWGHETFETVMSCYRFTKNKKRISIPAPNGRCGNV